MQDFLAGGVCFAEKATNSRSLFSNFSFHNSSSINHSRWASISKQLCWNKHSKYIHIIIIIFHLLLYVAENVKQSQTVRSRRFKSSFLTLQGKPNTHVWGTKSPTTFPLSFPSVNQGHPPRLQSTAILHPHVALILDFIQKRVRVKSTPRSNRVLCLPITIFLGMWLVRSNT